MLAVALRQLSIDEIPLGLERATKDGIAGFLGRRFEFIQGHLRLQCGEVGGGKVEGDKFGHLLRSRIVDATDQHADRTHAILLGQDNRCMLPQSELVPSPT